MAKEETIYDFYHRKIGSIENKPNGDKVGYDFYHRVVGFYDKQLNATMDFYHRVVGHGDMLSALIFNANEGNGIKK